MISSKLVVLFGVLISLALGANIPATNLGIAPRGGINDKLIEVIENLKYQMPCGLEEMGIPILAPLKQEYLEVNIAKNLAEIMVSAFDLRVDGLNKFDINSVSLNVLSLKFKFDFTFKEIRARTNYVANALLLKFIRVKGNGDADVTLKDLRLVGEAQIGANAEGLYMKDFKITIVLGQFKSDITGLLWGKYTGKLANAMIEKAVPFVLKHKHDDVAALVSDVVIKMASEKLKGVTIKDIMDIINNPSEPKECIPEPEDETTFISNETDVAMAEFERLVQLIK